MPFQIETDAHWRAVLGRDGPAWANAYLRTRRHHEGDMQLHELAAWFDAAIGEGTRIEREIIAGGWAADD